MEAFELSDFIAQLRAELSTAILEGANSKLRFVAKAVELELEIGAETRNDGSGKISFKVFGIGAEGGGGLARGSTVTHKLKLTLEPIDAVTSKNPLISAGIRNRGRS
jgi:hypothetical protein